MAVLQTASRRSRRLSGTKPEFEGLETVSATCKRDTAENEEVNTVESGNTELKTAANVSVPIVAASPRDDSEANAGAAIKVKTGINTYAKTKRIADAKNASTEAQPIILHKTGHWHEHFDHATSYHLTNKELKGNEVAFVINESRGIVQTSVVKDEVVAVPPIPPKKRFLKAAILIFLCLVVGATALMNSKILAALSVGRMQLESYLGLTNCGWSAVYRNHLHQLGHPRLA